MGGFSFVLNSAILICMNPEERSLLERTYKLTEENNKILISIRRSSRLSMVVKVLYWIVIIGLSFGAYYFIQPYINMLTGLSGQVKEGGANMQNIASQFGELFK